MPPQALYKKRAGTSGVSGHLYETKLIALILFRLLHHEAVLDFCLVSNMDEIGALDDICFKVKIEGRKRPIAIFIQAKHKDNNDKYPTFENKSESIKWFKSLSEIKKKVDASTNKDKFFNGDVNIEDCVFVLYTNAKCDFDSNRPYESEYHDFLNKLISTSSTVGSLPLYTEQHLEVFGQIILKDEIAILAKQFANFLSDREIRSKDIMNIECISQYHVILAHKVVHVSDLQTDGQNTDDKYRTLTFRPDFFETNDQYVMLFRDRLFKEMLKNQPQIRRKAEAGETMYPNSSKSEPSVDDLISCFLSSPSTATLTPLIITHVASNENGKLEFLLKRPAGDAELLRQLNISPSTIDEAYSAANTAVRHFLESLHLDGIDKSFGNVDLAIRGNAKKIERRLKYLATATVELCKKCKEKDEFKVVTINDTIDDGLLSANGGLASAVGNLLVYDIEINMLKFSNDFTLAQNNARTLFFKLKEGIHNLHEYRFDIKTMKFPKLNFDCTNVAREFLSKLVLFAKQATQSKVEEILKTEIQNYLKTNVHNYLMSSDLVFLHYHNEIQKWWMSSKTGEYLTKTSNSYQQSINNIVTEPQISALQITFNISHLQYFGYAFSEDATRWMELPGILSKLSIVTDTVAMTTLKVFQCLKNHYLLNSYVVIDLKYVFNLPSTDFSSLEAELIGTNKVIIIVWDCALSENVPRFRLYEVAQATKQKRIIVITSSTLMEVLNECFPFTNNSLHDETQNLCAFTAESQTEVIKDAKVIFQGEEVSLNLLLEDVSVAFITGGVLGKVIRKEPMHLGTPLSNSMYDEIKHLYVDRRVSEVSDVSEVSGEAHANSKVIRTFHDVHDDAVLVTAEAGMGKSILLTHLSIRTKEQDGRVWIVRVNLLNYAKQFYKWMTGKKDVDILEILRFICGIISKSDNISINLKNNEMLLRSCNSDDWVSFELNMFLHSYNKRKVIFLFDGFDEVCPHYKHTVINFFNVLRNHQKNKIWATSRSYSDLLPDLQMVFDKCFKIEHLSIAEQELYLERTWRGKIVFGKLDDVQQKNLKSFVNDISRTISSGFYYMYDLNVWIRRIFLHFYDFVHSNIECSELSKETIMIAQANSVTKEHVCTLTGTPLLLYFVADYIVNITENYEPRAAAQADVNVINIYEMFVENKLKKVLYQDKKKVDLYDPDVIIKLEKELTECITMHKKIAAYCLLHRDVYCGPNADEFKDMHPLYEGYVIDLNTTLNRIKSGSDKTGLISHVTVDDVPVFIHRTFTEYFAAGYICDVLKSKEFEFEKKKKWLNALAECCNEDVFIWIRFKSKLDSELTNIIRAIDVTESFILSLI